MADIVLRDRSGNPVEYPGIERIKLNTVDGEAVEFVDPALIPESVETTITPDFSGGSMEVVPDDGAMFSKVTVSKPATLAPEYIAEGVDIAGIVGTLAAGGAKIASGTIASRVSNKTVTHNLGVIPDIAIFVAASRYTANQVSFIFQISKKLNSTYKLPNPYTAVLGGNNEVVQMSDAYFTDTANGVVGCFENATVKTIKITGGSSYYLQASSKWLLIGGLT